MGNVGSTNGQTAINSINSARLNNANQSTESQLANGQLVKATETENNRIPVEKEKRPNIFKRLFNRVIEAISYVWNKFISLFSSKESRGGIATKLGDTSQSASQDSLHKTDENLVNQPNNGETVETSVSQQDPQTIDDKTVPLEKIVAGAGNVAAGTGQVLTGFVQVANDVTCGAAGAVNTISDRFLQESEQNKKRLKDRFNQVVLKKHDNNEVILSEDITDIIHDENLFSYIVTNGLYDHYKSTSESQDRLSDLANRVRNQLANNSTCLENRINLIKFIKKLQEVRDVYIDDNPIAKDHHDIDNEEVGVSGSFEIVSNEGDINPEQEQTLEKNRALGTLINTTCRGIKVCRNVFLTTASHLGITPNKDLNLYLYDLIIRYKHDLEVPLEEIQNIMSGGINQDILNRHLLEEIKCHENKKDIPNEELLTIYKGLLIHINKIGKLAEEATEVKNIRKHLEQISLLVAK